MHVFGSGKGLFSIWDNTNIINGKEGSSPSWLNPSQTTLLLTEPLVAKKKNQFWKYLLGHRSWYKSSVGRLILSTVWRIISTVSHKSRRNYNYVKDCLAFLSILFFSFYASKTFLRLLSFSHILMWCSYTINPVHRVEDYSQKIYTTLEPC